jgi:hypothetical protein
MPGRWVTMIVSRPRKYVRSSEIQLNALFARREQGAWHVGILHESVLHPHVVDTEAKRLNLNLLFRWDVRRV